MYDPFSWSVPLFRAFNILVRVHLLYIVFTIGMVLRQYMVDERFLLEYVVIWVVMLFVIVLLHEFGHCFAARKVDGEADEILMWPLGGLAYCSVPQTVRANLITVLGGPLVNVGIALGMGATLLAAGYFPPINVFKFNQLYHPQLHNWKTGETEIPLHVDRFYVRKATDDQSSYSDRIVVGKAHELKDGSLVIQQADKIIPVERPENKFYPAWALWGARLFWLNWLLLVFNCIPAFPMDGGRILQCILWHRLDDYARATQIAAYVGLGFCILFFLAAMVLMDPLLFALGLFIGFTCYQQLLILRMGAEDRGAFGYDFSKGYAGFGPDEDAPPTPKRPGFIQRWRLARKVKRELREAEQNAADESRLDELLTKIGQHGKDSLTPEEKRFMDRLSARYRNRL